LRNRWIFVCCHPTPYLPPHLTALLLAGLVLLQLGAAAEALAQGSPTERGPQARPRWQWPEKAENLQELPEDFPPERLSAVMRGFTRALGVRCSHCHVGEEGAPLSSYDFPSDDNPNKGRAREMLRMLASINEHLQKIEPSGAERVNMWCHTCHRGRPRPMTLGDAMTEAYKEGGIAAAVQEYRDLRERFADRGAYDFGENSLNRIGYALLGEGDTEGAISIFRLNLEQFPDSANAHDSLAEGYLKAGRKELAEIFYRKSLELDPDNRNALDKLREMASGSDGPPAEVSDSDS